ncbi:hypothetical protein CSOJ01_10179 [Colletotrichum sojae]|uniref:Uncharacterized protein n=1 Tax=Colletotrichum sojae TaxID=2175907 RepID=A0A8H6MPJ2_9PEZI|nr:hypothetical protein CSOJ01_10179 [Colletotrichum sojae]
MGFDSSTASTKGCGSLLTAPAFPRWDAASTVRIGRCDAVNNVILSLRVHTVHRVCPAPRVVTGKLHSVVAVRDAMPNSIASLPEGATASPHPRDDGDDADLGQLAVMASAWMDDQQEQRPQMSLSFAGL